MDITTSQAVHARLREFGVKLVSALARAAALALLAVGQYGITYAIKHYSPEHFKGLLSYVDGVSSIGFLVIYIALLWDLAMVFFPSAATFDRLKAQAMLNDPMTPKSSQPLTVDVTPSAPRKSRNKRDRSGRGK